MLRVKKNVPGWVILFFALNRGDPIEAVLGTALTQLTIEAKLDGFDEGVQSSSPGWLAAAAACHGSAKAGF